MGNSMEKKLSLSDESTLRNRGGLSRINRGQVMKGRSLGDRASENDEKYSGGSALKGILACLGKGLGKK